MTYRLFVAATLHNRTIQHIIQIRNNLNKNFYFNHYKWITENNLHLTLTFLGHVEKEKLQLLEQLKLQWINDNMQFDEPLVPVKITGFPNIKKAKVLSILFKEHKELSHFKLSFERELNKLHIQYDRKDFKPHMTILRYIQPTTIDKSILDYIIEPVFLNIETISLLQSRTLPEGLQYTIITNYFQR